MGAIGAGRTVPPPATMRNTLLTPLNLTLALTVALAAAGTALTLNAADVPVLHSPAGSTAALGLAALTVAFFVTELGQALVEVRRQAYSFSLAGIPLVLGLLYFPPRELIAARIGASLLAFLVQKSAPIKISFNTASYLLDTALVIAVAHALLGSGNGLTLRTAGLCYLSLAAVDILMSLLVLLVIRINQGPVSRGEAIEVLLPAAAFVFLNTAFAFIAALLVSRGALGVVLLAVFALVTGAVYRGYLVLRRRHQWLQVVQSFIESSEATGTVEELAGRMLIRIRDVVRASRVELRLQDSDGTAGLVVFVDEDDQVSLGSRGRRTTDRLPHHRPGH